METAPFTTPAPAVLTLKQRDRPSLSWVRRSASLCFCCCCCSEHYSFASNHLISNSYSLRTCWWLFICSTVMIGLPWKSCHFYCQFFGWRCFYKSFKKVCKSSRNCTTNSMLCSCESLFVRPVLEWPSLPVRDILGRKISKHLRACCPQLSGVLSCHDN